LETENDKLAKENKRLLALRKASEKSGEVDQKMKESLAVAQREREGKSEY